MNFYRDWHTPRVLTLDLDDTLYDNGPVIDYAEDYIKTRIGVEYLDGNRLINEVYSSVRQEMLSVCPELEYDVSMLRYFIFKELLLRAGKSSDDSGAIAEALMHDFIKVRSRINVPRETLDVLYRLKQRYPLIGLTNGNSSPKLARYEDCFDEVILAAVNMPSKPNPAMFLYAAMYVGVDISEVCHPVRRSRNVQSGSDGTRRNRLSPIRNSALSGLSSSQPLLVPQKRNRAPISR